MNYKCMCIRMCMGMGMCMCTYEPYVICVYMFIGMCLHMGSMCVCMCMCTVAVNSMWNSKVLYVKVPSQPYAWEAADHDWGFRDFGMTTSYAGVAISMSAKYHQY